VQEAYGDIWNWLAEPHNCEVVIPTNIGWKSDGSNVMGAGIAKQAILRYGRDIAKWYGAICQACGPHTPVVIHEEHPLIFFPVKTLDYDDPQLSWRRDADLALIERSTQQLAALRLGPFALPMVGCGNGKLNEADVYPILKSAFQNENHVTLVRYARASDRSNAARPT
jgi:hypothetical protein